MWTETRKGDRDAEPSIWLILPVVFVAISALWLVALSLFYYLTNGKFDESFNGTN